MLKTNQQSFSRRFLTRVIHGLLLFALTLTTFSFPAESRIPARKKQKQRETSADVKKRHESTRKEIKLTEDQIKENERRVKNELNELGKLQTDIAESKKKISATTTRIAALDSKIGTLRDSISANEKELEHLRREYLKAVKKMRLTRRGSSALAFIFASENFHQALRRMRYMKEFSAWRERQSASIRDKNAALTRQRDELASTRAEHDRALALQRKEQSTLQSQYSRQDAIVAGLKSDGAALKSHLSKKQAEAVTLRERISQLIAEEERKAAEERRAAEEKARIEAERKAAEEKARIEAERKAAEEKARIEAERKAAEDRRTAEERARIEADHKQQQEKLKQDEKLKKEEEAKRKKEEEKRRKEEEKRRKEEEKRRKAESKKKPATKPVADTPKPAAPKPTAPKPVVVESAGKDFAAMRGSLPRPVSGSFKVTSRFGRQSLPDLPDVVFDNPGIDAEASAGASALAVYPGKVSGVYMLPGYNTVVIVNHGNYYTVYGNIARASVKVGDAVRAGQALGALAAEEDDNRHTSIHFEVWRNREKLNPLDWIR